MNKRDKEFECRMQGMHYAYKIANEKGVDALLEEIKKRGVLKCPLSYTSTQMDNFWHELSTNLYNNMLMTTLYALKELLGFGKKRMTDFKLEYDKLIEDTMDLSYMGEHYVTLGDYAKELNEKYNLGFDLSRIEECQKKSDEANPNYHMASMEVVLEKLSNKGFSDAAEYLESILM